MKKSMFIFLMIAIFASGLYAQEVPKKTKIYRVVVSLNNEPFKVKGALYRINDSSVVVLSSLRMKDYTENNYEKVVVNIEDIEKIKIRRNGSIGTGALLGAVTGFTAGFIAGSSTSENSYLSENSSGFIIGVPSAIAAATIGAIIGTYNIKITINGCIENYNRNQEKLKEYSIVNQKSS